MNLEWTFVLFTHFGVTTGITQGFRVIPEVTPKWVKAQMFTPNSLFSKIHSLKSEHIHSFLFREYIRRRLIYTRRWPCQPLSCMVYIILYTWCTPSAHSSLNAVFLTIGLYCQLIRIKDMDTSEERGISLVWCVGNVAMEENVTIHEGERCKQHK